MTVIRDVRVELDPRDVVIDGKICGTADNISVEVGEATEEELEALKKTPVILLLRRLEDG